MSDKPNSVIVEGDFAKVKLELRGGPAEAKVKRPGPGSMLLWGGTAPSSPWGHLIELIEKSGGQVSFTQVHAAAFEEHAHELPRPGGAPGAAPMQDEPTQAPPPEEKKEAAEGGPAPKEVPPTTPAHSAGEDHHSGAAGKGPLFEYGVTFAYNGDEARVWAHPRAANAGPRPLVILLHGLNGDPGHEKHPALHSNAGKVGKNDKWIHVGKLAEKMIDEGKVTPLLIAAPTHRKDNGVWSTFELDKFVNQVEQQVRALGVEIDLDQVSLAAHSGAGGFPGAGLNKIADQGAIFSGHKLRVFGIEDTRIIAPTAKEYVDKLKAKGNDVTAIFAVHRGTGGWATPEYTSNGGSSKFAAALGATTKVTDHFVGNECLEDLEDYYDNGEAKPARVSIKVKESKLAKYHGIWETAGGYRKHGSYIPHSDMVPMWSWLALPRFYPQTEADKKLMAAHAASKEESPPPAPPAPKAPAGPPAITGGEPNIPAAPAIWVNPAGEIAPKAYAPAQFADATSAIYWPVRQEKHPDKRGVHYTGEDGQTYNPKGKGGSGCHFLAGRANGRKHVGIDLNFGSQNAIVVSCEAGKIVAFYQFLGTVNCIIVQHDSGLVINYGEVSPNSLKEFNLKVGDHVTAGQPIGRVGRCPEGDSMLHFETYPAGVTRNVSYPAGKGNDWLSNYRNPTAYLLYLAKNGR